MPDENDSNTYPAANSIELLPETHALLAQMRADPRRPLACVQGDSEPAVVVREMNAGCATLYDKVQPLCAQHDVTRTPVDNDVLVLDLSLGAAWSDHRGHTPLYYITSSYELADFATRPK